MQYNWNYIDVKNNTNDGLLLEYRECPICGQNDAMTVLKLENFQFFSDSNINPKQVTIQEQICSNCQAIFLNPCYTEKGFSILFEEAGQSYGSTIQRPDEQYNWMDDRGLLQSGNSILDIGCGSGNFLVSLPDNINKIGVDIDQNSIDSAKEKNSDITFICSPFERLKYDEKLDVITMFHVLEHVSMPLQTLKRLHSISDKNTKLIVEVPIIENGLTNDINGFFSVQHLTHFSRNSLKNILTLSGWSIIEWQEQEDYNGCRVLAERIQASEKINIDYKQKSLLYAYLQNWYKSINDAENKLLKMNGELCIIWGAGMHIEFVYQISSLFDRDIKFIIVDKDKNKQNKTWRGIKIHDPSIIAGLLNMNPEFVISSYGNQEAIKEELLMFGVSPEKIVSLYDYIKVY